MAKQFKEQAGMYHQEITGQVIGTAFEAYNHRGYCYLKKSYKNAMKVELGLRKVPSILEVTVRVSFKNHTVGNYFADLFVAEVVIVELKVAKVYNPADEAQLLNELEATGIKVGLLINFGIEQVEFKRIVY